MMARLMKKNGCDLLVLRDTTKKEREAKPIIMTIACSPLGLSRKKMPAK